MCWGTEQKIPEVDKKERETSGYNNYLSQNLNTFPGPWEVSISGININQVEAYLKLIAIR